MDRDGFLPLIRRWILLLVAAAVAAGVVGYVAASRIAPTYESRARLLVGPLNTDIDTLRASGVLTRTYAELATSEQVLSKAAGALGGDITARDLRRSVRAHANDITRLLTIRATSRDPALAARTAEAVSEEFIRLTSGTPEQPAPPAGIATLFDAAEVPRAPVGPNTRLHVMLSMLAGALVALAIAFVIETFGRSRLLGAREPRSSPVAVAPAAGQPEAASNPAGFWRKRAQA